MESWKTFCKKCHVALRDKNLEDLSRYARSLVNNAGQQVVALRDKFPESPPPNTTPTADHPPSPSPNIIITFTTLTPATPSLPPPVTTTDHKFRVGATRHTNFHHFSFLSRTSQSSLR
ncbi:hypothetical protein E3N88_07337 [Mikania micrantha]|uniref:Uncharacterized protein n=1 Tax=Mikania micrantha TaxID=192012 RepID=A0A5N6PRZ1_9ASTR|nr:hypothetical protein E3N88_07337 [Mikania micrantha]